MSTPNVKIRVDLEDNMTRGLGATTSSLNQLKSVAASVGLAFGALEVFNFAKGFIDGAAAMEKTRTLLTGITKDAIAAESSFQWMLDFGSKNSAAVGVESLQKTFVKLKIAGIDPTNGSLQALTDGVAAFGGSSYDLELAGLAVFQMLGKGSISMEELRRQLGERIPNASRLMAQELGISIETLTKLVEKGKLSGEWTKVAVEALMRGMAKEYEGAAERMKSTWVGAMNQMEYSWGVFKGRLGESTAFEYLKDKLIRLLESLNGPDGLSAALDTITKNFKDVVSTIGDVIVAFGLWIAAAKAVAIANAAMVGVGTLLPALTGGIAGLSGALLNASLAASALGKGLLAAAGGWPVVAITAAGFAIYKLATYQTEAEKTARTYYSAARDVDKILAQSKNSAEGLASAYKELGAQELQLLQIESRRKMYQAKDAAEALKTQMSGKLNMSDLAGLDLDLPEEAGMDKIRGIVDGLKEGKVSAMDAVIAFERLRDTLKPDEQNANFRRTLTDVSDKLRLVASSEKEATRQAEIFEGVSRRLVSMRNGPSKNIKEGGVTQEQTDELNKMAHGDTEKKEQQRLEHLRNAIRAINVEYAGLSGEQKDVWEAKLKDRVADMLGAVKRYGGSASDMAEAKRKTDDIFKTEMVAIGAGFENQIKLKDALQKFNDQFTALAIGDKRADDLAKLKRENKKLVDAGYITPDQARNMEGLQKEQWNKEKRKKDLEAIRQFYQQYYDISGEGFSAIEELIQQEAQVFRDAKIDEAKVAKWAEYEKLKYSREWQAGVKLGVKDYVDDAENAAKSAKDAFGKMASSMEDALVEFVTKGKISFSSLIDSMLADLVRLVAKRAIFAPLFKGAEGLLDAWFGGAPSVPTTVDTDYAAALNAMTPSVSHASGGNVYAGKLYRVNESGKEIFAPAMDGRVIPSAQGGTGAAANVKVDVHNYSSSKATVEEKQDARGGRSITVIVGEATAAEMRRPGSAPYKALAQNFGARQTLVRR